MPDNPVLYRIEFEIDPDGTAAYFENGVVKIVNDDTKEEYTIDEIQDFSVYGTTFDISKDAWKFYNNEWNEKIDKDTNRSILEGFEDAADEIEDRVFPTKWRELHVSFLVKKDEFIVGGGCYGLAETIVANFNNTNQNNDAWGTGDISQWNLEIEKHWPDGKDKAEDPHKSLEEFQDISVYENYYNKETGWTLDAAKKILYYHATQSDYDRIYGLKDGNGIGETTIVPFSRNSSKLILERGKIVLFGFRVWSSLNGKRKSIGHAVAITQKIEWNGSEQWVMWDNNMPYNRRLPEYLGHYMVWLVQDSENYEKSFNDAMSQPGENFSNRITAVSIKYGKPYYQEITTKNNKKKKSGYELVGVSNVNIKMICPGEQYDPQNIYNLWNEWKNLKLSTNTNRRADPPADSEIISDSYPDHIEVQIIGGTIDNITLQSSGTSINPIPNGEIKPDQAVINTTMGGVYNHLYLPADQTYRIDTTKYADFYTLKIFVKIPNGDGTLETINYKNLEIAPDDPTSVYFYVGRNNTDKNIHRAGDLIPPDYDSNSAVILSPPTNFANTYDKGKALLTWENPTHSGFDHVLIIRKEASYPESSTDGVFIYQGDSEQFEDRDALAGFGYYYAAFSADSQGNFSEPAYCWLDTRRYSITGQVTLTGGEPLSGVQLLLKDSGGAIQYQASTGSDGRYTLANLRNDHYSLEAVHPSHSIQPPTREVTINMANLTEDFIAYPVLTLSLLFSFNELLVGDAPYIRWGYAHIDNSATVDIRLFRNGAWETLAAAVPILQGQFLWDVVGPEAVDATLQIALTGSPEVKDEAICTILKGPDPGDLNYDGVIDLTDAILALQVVAGIPPSQAIYVQADINGDLKIGLEEAIYILQTSAGL